MNNWTIAWEMQKFIKSVKKMASKMPDESWLENWSPTECQGVETNYGDLA